MLSDASVSVSPATALPDGIQDSSIDRLFSMSGEVGVVDGSDLRETVLAIAHYRRLHKPVVWIPKADFSYPQLWHRLLAKSVAGVVAESPSALHDLPLSKWEVLKKASIVFPRSQDPDRSREPGAGKPTVARLRLNRVVDAATDDTGSSDRTEADIKRSLDDQLRDAFADRPFLPHICVDNSGALGVRSLLSLMSQGVVVITVGNDAAHAIIENGVSGICVERALDADAQIESHLSILETTPERLDAMSTAARQRVKELCSEDARARQWQNVVMRVTGERPRIIRVGSSKTLWTIQANQIRRQRQTGADIAIVADSGEYRNRLLSLGCPIEDVGLPRRPGLPQILFLALQFALFLKSSSVILHSHNVPATIIVRIAAALRPRSFAVFETVHNMNDLLASTRSAVGCRAVLRLTRRKADQSLFISRDYLDKATRLRLTNRDVSEVVGTGIDVERFRSMQRQDRRLGTRREKFGASPDTKIFVSVARFDPQKGHRILLQAFAEVCKRANRDLLLLLVGDGPTESATQELANDLGISKQIRFLGQRDDVPRILAASDVLVLASSHEGFGRCIVEGLLSRIPVIATETEGPKLILQETARSWLTQHDPISLAEAMQAALQGLTDTELNDNERVGERFDELRIADSVLDLYQRDFIR